jgi:hypothetical protein
MGTKLPKNDGCLLPFGNNFLQLFGLLVLNDDEIRRRAENTEDEDEDYDIEEDGEFEVCGDIGNEDE